MTTTTQCLVDDGVDEMDDFALLYHYFTAQGDNLIGNSQTTFASFQEDSGRLIVATKDPNLIVHCPYRECAEKASLEYAQEHAATFAVSGSQVVCILGGVTATGGSYVQAALRAAVRHARLNSVSAG